MSRRTLKSIIAAKGYALTSYISMPGGLGAELYARQGWGRDHARPAARTPRL